MNKALKKSIILLGIYLYCSFTATSQDSGSISGTLVLDDSWERQIYLTLIETFEKEYSISNSLIAESSVIDSLGNFKITLKEVPPKWSLLRLHIVKKGVSPNSLVIGGKDENYYFLVAKRSSNISLYNTTEKPLFGNTRVKGAPYMSTFEYIRKLSNYPNAIDYEKSLIEKEFIEDVVSEKLRTVADTCKNPLVSLYALYQTDFYSDYNEDPAFYAEYLSKWKNEDNKYFKSFRLKLPTIQQLPTTQNFLWKYSLIFISIGIAILAGIFIYSKRDQKITKLSVQERKIFNLLQKGLSNKEISTECNIELSTVKSHISNIYSKLDIKSRREAINLKIK